MSGIASDCKRDGSGFDFILGVWIIFIFLAVLSSAIFGEWSVLTLGISAYMRNIVWRYKICSYCIYFFIDFIGQTIVKCSQRRIQKCITIKLYQRDEIRKGSFIFFNFLFLISIFLFCYVYTFKIVIIFAFIYKDKITFNLKKILSCTSIDSNLCPFAWDA